MNYQEIVNSGLIAELADEVEGLINGGVDAEARADIAVLKTSVGDLSNIITVEAAADVYTLDAAGSLYKMFSIESADANAKTIEIDNAPSEPDVLIQVAVLFIATTACAITHPTGAVFAAGAPTFTTGQSYWLLYESTDGGTTWAAYSVRRT